MFAVILFISNNDVDIEYPTINPGPLSPVVIDICCIIDEFMNDILV